METPLQTFSPQAEQLLTEYPWPGNVRELQNAIEYSANLCEEKELTPDALPEYLTCPAQELPCKAPAPPREEDQIKSPADQVRLHPGGQEDDRQNSLASVCGHCTASWTSIS